jgi:hypothetical protein
MINNFLDIQNNVYATLWNKYRPSLLKMMMAASEAPQQYKFYSHEFKAMKATEKSFSFALKVDNGRAVNPTKVPAIAKDLLTVLQYSKKATELMENQSYEFKLDRNFLLHVTRLEPTTAPPATPTPA